MNIFQIYLSENEHQPLPELLKINSEHIKNVFQDCTYQLFTNTSLRNFIKDNYHDDVLIAYDTLIPFSYKSDLGRFCLLNKLGGFYFDMTIRLLSSIIIDENVQMLLFRDIQKNSLTCWACTTGVMFSKPSNQVLDLAISIIVNNCKTCYYGISPLCPTGPTVLGEALCKTGATIKILYGDTKYLTPEYDIKNLSFILQNGSIFALGKEPGKQLTDFGGQGVNNYTNLWYNKNVYARINKLIDIPVVFISPDNNEKYNKRKLNTESLLTQIGFKTFSHHISSSEKYPKCLAKANIDILSQNLDDNPILIVEDDIAWTGVTTVYIPTSVDCMYLGFSICAGDTVHNTNTGTCSVNYVSQNVYKINNMLSAHAILYISKRFKEAAIKCFQEAYDSGHHTDVILSRILSRFNVYANSKPVFYQNDETNIENSVKTKIYFEEHSIKKL